jgi:DNA polymerase-3 subunit alpha
LGDAIGRAEDHFNFVISNTSKEEFSLAVTDHGNATEFGYVYAAKEKLKKAGIKFRPIYGCELYIHPDLQLWAKQKQEKQEEATSEEAVVEVESESKNKNKWFDPIKRRHHLVVLAQNQIGLKNLYKIISESYRNGFYRFPRTDFKSLEKNKEGLIISSACLAGLPSWIALRDIEKGKDEVFKSFDKELKPLLDIFGKEKAFLEIHFNSIPEQKIVNQLIEEYSRISGYAAIAAADSHYAKPEWWREREIYRLLAQQSKGYDVNPDDLPKSIDELKCELYPKNAQQMFESYKKFNPELDESFVCDSINRTHSIAFDLIEDFSIDTSYKLPKIFLQGKDPFEELKLLAFEGLEAKNLADDEEYIERFAKELSVIKKKGLSTYFLTLKRAIDAIKKNLLLGAGRGSGASSLINYCLGITLVDPIKNKLLFERFISENRNEPADVDTDIEDRDKALDVLRKEFGPDNVISITNFNGLQLKSLVKDISKLYGIDFAEVNNVTRVMEAEARQPILDSIGNDQKLYVFDLDGATKYSKTFQAFLQKYPHVADSIKILFKQNKSYGRHAGGVIITENAEECMPIIRVKGTDQTPWSEGLTAKHLEPFGLIKYDFLGLSTLRIVRNCIERILINQNIEPTLENVNIFYNKNLHPDVIKSGQVEVFEKVFHSGKFCGTFQFSEVAAQNFCKEVKPESIEDISAITSIMRPGPLKSGANKRYLQAKRNKDEISWEHPVLKEVLEPTYSVLCYQEQFMQIAHKLAGFSLTEADELRKMLMKPIASMADEIKAKRKEAEVRFIQGCVNNGLEQSRAVELWENEILGFISYGFVKSHSISYSILSYQCAYLSCYYPDEWVCAYLECDSNQQDAIREVKTLGYEVAKADILSSGKMWSVNSKIIYPPLSALKGIGDAAIDEIVCRRSWWQQEVQKTDAPIEPIEKFNKFFYDTEQKVLKKSIKEKKVWHFSKFNKRAMDVLCKTESLGGLDLIGNQKIFLNHAHFYRGLIENWDLKERKNFDLNEIAKTTKSDDWTNAEKIQFQADIFGAVPSHLILDSDEIAAIEQYGICDLSYLTDLALNDTDEVQKYWFCITDLEVKKSKSGKPFWKLFISNLKDVEISFNWFNLEPKEKFEKYGIYIAELYYSDSGWLNVKKGSYIERLK